jgi:hypothetical protein
MKEHISGEMTALELFIISIGPLTAAMSLICFFPALASLTVFLIEMPIDNNLLM